MYWKQLLRIVPKLTLLHNQAVKWSHENAVGTGFKDSNNSFIKDISVLHLI